MHVLTQDYKDRIAGIVSEVLEIDREDLTEHSRFKEDHGADSLRAIEILAALERTFGVEINQSELSRMVNLRGIHEVVAEAAATAGHAE